MSGAIWVCDRLAAAGWEVKVAHERKVCDVAPLEELGPLARADARIVLLVPGAGELLGLTIASEIGDVTRLGSPPELIGYAGLAPKIR